MSSNFLYLNPDIQARHDRHVTNKLKKIKADGTAEIDSTPNGFAFTLPPPPPPNLSIIKQAIALKFLISLIVFSLFFSQFTWAKEKVAIFDPTGSLSKADGEIVRELISEEVVKSGRYLLVERENINQVLKEVAYQQSGAVDEKDASRLGKQLGADLVCITVAHKQKEQFFISCRFVDVETAAVSGSGTGRHSKLFGATKSATSKMLKSHRKVLAKGVIKKPGAAIALNVFLPFGIGSYIQKDPNAWVLTLMDVAWLGTLGGYYIVNNDIVNNDSGTRPLEDNLRLSQSLLISTIVLGATSAVLGIVLPLTHYKKLQKRGISFLSRLEMEQAIENKGDNYSQYPVGVRLGLNLERRF